MSLSLDEVFCAASNGDDREIQAIVRKTVDKKQPSGRTPLMQAAVHGHNKVLEQLLAFGAVPDVGDNEGNTALHEACESGSLDTVHILLEHEANINVKNNQGDTPLHSAAFGCNLDVVEMLLERGAKVSVRNNDRQTAKEKLKNTEKSSRHNEGEAEAIVKLLHEWRTDKAAGLKKSAKSHKEESIDCLKEIKENVSVMNTAVITLVDKIEELSTELKDTTKKLVVSEEKTTRYEQQLDALKQGVFLMQTDMKKNGESANNKLLKLIDITDSIFANMCHESDFNDRVYYSIFQNIATVVSSKEDCWKELARNIFAGYPPSYINKQINEVTAAYQSDQERAHEMLLRWKVIVGNWMHKLEPLKNIIREMNTEGTEALCEKIDSVVDKHTKRSYEEPTGSLSEKGLLKLAKELGTKWRDLGTHLEFTTANLDGLRESYPNSDDRNHHMLVQWTQREAGFNQVKLGRLVQALILIGRRDLAEGLTI